MAPSPASAAAARGGSQGDAAQAVLGNVDLLEQILRFHATPTLVFGKLKGLPYEPRARWAASHVNRLFWDTALRLPWGVSWDARSSRDFVAICGKPGRNVVFLEICIRQQTLPDCATLLRYASSVQDLQVTCWGGGVLDSWLQRTRVLTGNFLQGKTVLAHLSSSLKDLRSIEVGSSGYVWTDASWLTRLTQLSRVVLYKYAGSQVALALPELKSLRVSCYPKKVDPTLWAVPGLTDLQFIACSGFSPFQVDYNTGPVGGGSSDARLWLRGLQRLNLCNSQLDLPEGLGALVPSLTYLNLVWGWASEPSGKVFSQGLPTTLRELRVLFRDGSTTRFFWPSVFALKHLEALEVDMRQEGDHRLEHAVLAEGLSALGPQLLVVNLTLPSRSGLRTSLSSLQALLQSRGGSLSLNIVTGARC